MTVSIDHVMLSVGDYAKGKAFFTAALAPLRIVPIMEFGEGVGMGADGKPFLWIGGGAKATPHAHIAIAAENRAQVDAFYKAAMAAGAKDNGPPGVRAHYHASYYAAFILDPDGNNIEAVCHAPA